MNLFNDLRQQMAAPTAEIRLTDYYQEADEAELSFHMLTTLVPFLADPEVVPFSFEDINTSSRPGHIALPLLEDACSLLQRQLPHKKMWVETTFAAEDKSASHVACLAQQVRPDTMAFIPILSTGGRLVLTGMAYISRPTSEGKFELLDLFSRRLPETDSAESAFFQRFICHFLNALHSPGESACKLTPISPVMFDGNSSRDGHRSHSTKIFALDAFPQETYH